MISYSEEELAAWLMNPVTRGFRADIEESIQQLSDQVTSGSTLAGESAVDSVKDTAKVVGQIQALRSVVEFMVSREKMLKKKAGDRDGSDDSDE